MLREIKKSGGEKLRHRTQLYLVARTTEAKWLAGTGGKISLSLKVAERDVDVAKAGIEDAAPIAAATAVTAI